MHSCTTISVSPDANLLVELVMQIKSMLLIIVSWIVFINIAIRCVGSLIDPRDILLNHTSSQCGRIFAMGPKFELYLRDIVPLLVNAASKCRYLCLSHFRPTTPLHRTRYTTKPLFFVISHRPTLHHGTYNGVPLDPLHCPVAPH